MNATQRKAIEKMVSALERMEGDLEEISGEQTDMLEGKSVKWHESERGATEQACADALESAVQSIQELRDHLETAKAEE